MVEFIIIEYGKKDLEIVDKILSKSSVSDGNLDLARKTMSMWVKGIDLFMDEDERIMLDEQRTQLHIISGDAEVKLNKINKLSLNNIVFKQ